MTTLLDTIRDTRNALDRVTDDKKAALVDSLMQLTRRMVDNVAALNDIPERYLSGLETAINDQIHAAEKRTEIAANDILGATEKIMAVLPALSGPLKDDIQDQVNILFEAANFQDLVSQHLNEIKLRLNELGADMRLLHSAMGGLTSGDGSASRAREPRRADAHLLNGPSTQV